MGKTPQKNRNVVVKTQFNINGSRGKDAGAFISDYVARDSATDVSTAYVPIEGVPIEQGDGVTFTLREGAISRQDTLALAAHVQTLHKEGDRAIEQMVLSFDPAYLVERGIVSEDAMILARGGYRYNYDDVRIRHAVQQGMMAMIENEGYYDGNMVAAIQSDTLHLHVHAVVYENHEQIARKYGREERGVIRQSSLNRLLHRMDEDLKQTQAQGLVVTQRHLSPQELPDVNHYEMDVQDEDVAFVNRYLEILQEQEREEALRQKIDGVAEDIVEDITEDIESQYKER